MPRILFLTAGGVTSPFAMGHLSRCTILAKRILKVHPDSAFRFMIPREPSAVKMLKRLGYFVTASNNVEEEQKKLTALMKKEWPQIVIADRLNLGTRYLKWLKRWGKVLVSFDDAGQGIQFADIAVNPLIPNPLSDYPGYAYLTLSDGAEAQVRIKSKTRQCLVWLGGGNPPARLILKLLNQIKRLPWACEIRFQVFLKANQTVTAEIKRALEAFSEGSKVHGFSADFFDRLSLGDAAIVGGGLTMFESTRRGIPTAVMAVKEHQLYNVRNFLTQRTLMSAGTWKKIDPGFLRHGFQALLENPTERRRLSRNALKFWQRHNSTPPLEKIITVVSRERTPKQGAPYGQFWPRRITASTLSYAVHFTASRNIPLRISNYKEQEHATN